MDQGDRDALVLRVVELVGWDHAQARLEIDQWVNQGSSLKRLANTLAEMERKGSKVTTPSDWLCSMMKPGKTGPDGPLPPAAGKAKGPTPEQEARTLLRELKSMGYRLELAGSGDLKLVPVSDLTGHISNADKRRLREHKPALVKLLSASQADGGSTHASP